MADEILPPIMKRRAAEAAGLSRYFNGKPCPRGHLTERHVANGNCVICQGALRVANRERNNQRSNAYNKRRRAAEPELMRDRDREQYRKHAAKRLARAAEHYRENLEMMRERSRAYHAANPEYGRAYTKAWKAANPEHAKHLDRQHTARRRGAPGSHTKKDVAEIYAMQKGKCAGCRCSVGKKYDVDHIVAVSKGGSNNRANLQILCRPCNQRKRDKDPIEFARELGFLL